MIPLAVNHSVDAAETVDKSARPYKVVPAPSCRRKG